MRDWDERCGDIQRRGRAHRGLLASVNWKALLLVPLALLLAAAACGALVEIGVEAERSPDISTVATLEALQMQNAHLSTQVAALLDEATLPDVAGGGPSEALAFGLAEAEGEHSPGARGEVETPSSTSAPTLTMPNATYVNTRLGFAFDYPPRWYVFDGGAIIYLASYDMSSAPSMSTIPRGETRIEFLYGEAGRTLGLEAMAASARVRANAEGGGVLWEQHWELAGGNPAVRLQLAGRMGQTAALYTVINGRSLYVTGYGDLSRFDEVARTLRPHP